MTQPQTGCHFQAEFTTITTAGTRVQLSAADEHISRITFRGDSGNTGNIGIGKSDVSMTTASWVLKPGESITLNFGDKSVLLSDFWVDAATSGDKLNWIVGAEQITGAGSQFSHDHSAAGDGQTLTPGTLNLPAGAIDVITEIASGLKSGADAKLITGTPGTNGNLGKWNTDGDLIDGPAASDVHAAAHTAASHSDQAATGAELETLTDGSNADSLHAHGDPAQADQAALEAETNENTYAPPDLIKHSPGVAKAYCAVASDGTLQANSYNIASAANNSAGNYTVTFDVDFANANYACMVTPEGGDDSGFMGTPLVGSITVLNWDFSQAALQNGGFHLVAHGDQ